MNEKILKLINSKLAVKERNEDISKRSKQYLNQQKRMTPSNSHNGRR